MVKYGSWEGTWVVPGIAHPPSHPGPIPRVHPLPTGRYPVLMRAVTAGPDTRKNMVVGLRSVGQLSLSTEISGLRVMTEVYNVRDIGRIINHLVILQNK